MTETPLQIGPEQEIVRDTAHAPPVAGEPLPRPESAPWSPAQRIAFRFSFAYLVLYVTGMVNEWLGALGQESGQSWLGILAQPVNGLWRAVVPWAGTHLLRLAKPIAGARTTGACTTLCA